MDRQRRFSSVPVNYKELHNSGTTTMADRSSRKKDKRSEEVEEGATGREVLQIHATDKEVAELDSPKASGGARQKVKKDKQAAKPAGTTMEGDIADDRVFQEMDARLDEELIEQQNTRLRLQRMQRIRQRAAQRDALRRENKQLAAELNLNQGYVLDVNNFSIAESKRKVDEWMQQMESENLGQQLCGSVSEPGGVKTTQPVRPSQTLMADNRLQSAKQNAFSTRHRVLAFQDNRQNECTLTTIGNNTHRAKASDRDVIELTA